MKEEKVKAELVYLDDQGEQYKSFYPPEFVEVTLTIPHNTKIRWIDNKEAK